VSDYQVVLLGNFSPARQQSMLRFAEMLKIGWSRRGVDVFLVQPEPWASVWVPAKLFKWAAYIDQYVRFPHRVLQLATAQGWQPARPTVFHICDHSNSIYRRGLRGRRVVLTCHDLLAVRGALGEATYCHPSPTGRLLQKIILSYLRRTPWVACDSQATCADFRRLTGRGNDACIVTIPLALNAPFAPTSSAEVAARLARFPRLLDAPFVLHVGSSEARKNRAGVLRSFALALPRWPGRLVFAGDPLSESEKRVLRELRLPSDSVIETFNVTHDELAALYTRAHAMIFPSYSEGYGWPVLEAQACGCPVLCSNVTSLPEVANPSALLLAPDDYMGYADAIVALSNPAARAAQAAAGLAYAATFTEDRMFNAYTQLYQRALA
jgi:glycosyltransferase involved in cell wall biosynthesis